ncbi:type I restriction enzyme endonuclease domain-containing protein [Blastococcus brunescens]|uniref:type I restriction enzyme endonuclease domain-containing protein n=1 Tax=Blastococcus brunescens TaxID=1564165 RepID=UPI003BEEE898
MLAEPDRTSRFLAQVLALTKAFALAGSRTEAAAIRDDVALFADVRAAVLNIQHPDSSTPTPAAARRRWRRRSVSWSTRR